MEKCLDIGAVCAGERCIETREESGYFLARIFRIFFGCLAADVFDAPQ
jgi:hypothetical protein